MRLETPKGDSPTSSGDGSSAEDSVRQPVPRWKKIPHLVLAGIFLVLGVLGVLLPGLPATPFLLLTSYFLSKSSPRLNVALLNSRWLGPVLTDWQVHGGVRRHVKVQAIVAVVIAVGLTIFFSGYSLWPSVGVCVLAAIGIIVVLRLPSADSP